MANLTPTAVSKSSNFVTGPSGDKTNDVLSDLLANRTEEYSLMTSIADEFYGATPPANPNVGRKWRCSTTAGLYVANTTYRWNGSAWAVDVAETVSVPQRNCVLEGPVNSAGATILFSVGTGLTVDLKATVRLSFANGFTDDGGASDYFESITADDAAFWSSLPINSTVQLYIDRDSGGTVTGGYSTLTPVYQNYAPTHSAGLNWFDTNTQKMFVSNGSAWTQVWRVFVGTATTDADSVTAVVVNVNESGEIVRAADVIAKGPWVDVRAFGADYTGVVDCTAIVQGIVNTLQPVIGYNWGCVRKFITFPQGKYKIDGTVYLRSGIYIVGDGGAEITHDSTTALFDVTGINEWGIKELTITGVGKKGTGIYSTPSPDGITYDESTMRYEIDCVKSTYFNYGINITGFLGVITNVECNWNNYGCRIDQANAVGVQGCFENNVYDGLIIDGGTGIHVYGGTCIEGNDRNDLVINGGNQITLDTVYFESTYDTVSNYQIYVGSGTKTVTHLSFTNCFFGGGNNLLDGYFDKVSFLTINDCRGLSSYKGFEFTENVKCLKIDNIYQSEAYLYDNSNNVINKKNPVNLLPNPYFAKWINNTTLADWVPVYSAVDGRRSTECPTMETTITRSKNCAVKITAKIGTSYCAETLAIPSHVLPKIIGKRCTLGAWVYVPDIAAFGDYSNVKDGVAIYLKDDSSSFATQAIEIVPAIQSNMYKKGHWNFLSKIIDVPVTSTNLYLELYVSVGPIVVNEEKYAIFGEVILADGVYDAAALATASIETVDQYPLFGASRPTLELNIGKTYFDTALNAPIWWNGTAWIDAMGSLSASVTWDPESLTDGAGETSTAITVTGAALGDFVMVAAPYDLQGITCNGYVSAANKVKIRLQNETGGTIDLASGTWKVKVIK